MIGRIERIVTIPRGGVIGMFSLGIPFSGAPGQSQGRDGADIGKLGNASPPTRMVNCGGSRASRPADRP
jgi:hypothetical protein